ERGGGTPGGARLPRDAASRDPGRRAARGARGARRALAGLARGPPTPDRRHPLRLKSRGRPSAKALTPGRRGLGASEQRSAQRASSGRAPRNQRRPSAKALTPGRRGLGASEQRSARSARAADGPPESAEAERESA